MLNCDQETSIPDWLIEYPETAAVFDELEIETGCGGISLEYACHKAGLDVSTIIRQLVSVIECNSRDEL